MSFVDVVFMSPSLPLLPLGKGHDFLAKTYDAKLRGHVTLSQFKEAHAALTVDLRRFPRLRKLARQEPRVAQALILLHARADGYKRKIDESPIYLHSCEVAEKILSLPKAVMPKPEQRLLNVIKILMHDMVEDFHAKPAEIGSLFGRAAQTRTVLVTSPPLEFLAQHFHETTRHYTTLPKDASLKAIDAHLGDLKSANPGTYDALKSALKAKHKAEIAEFYLTSEALYRAIDSTHSFVSYIRDIRKGILAVVPDEAAAERLKKAAPTLHGKPIKTILTKTARDNITNRTEANDAIIKRVRDIRDRAEKAGAPRKVLRRHDLTLYIIQKNFDGEKAKFEKALAPKINRFALIDRVATLMML